MTHRINIAAAVAWCLFVPLSWADNDSPEAFVQCIGNPALARAHGGELTLIEVLETGSAGVRVRRIKSSSDKTPDTFLVSGYRKTASDDPNACSWAHVGELHAGQQLLGLFRQGPDDRWNERSVICDGRNLLIDDFADLDQSTRERAHQLMATGLLPEPEDRQWGTAPKRYTDDQATAFAKVLAAATFPTSPAALCAQLGIAPARLSPPVAYVGFKAVIEHTPLSSRYVIAFMHGDVGSPLVTRAAISSQQWTNTEICQFTEPLPAMPPDRVTKTEVYEVATAICLGQTDTVGRQLQEFRARGVRVDELWPCMPMSPVRLAASKSHPQLLRMLLAEITENHYAEPDELLKAIARGDIEIVKTLLEGRPSLAKSGDAMVARAARRGDMALVSVLLQHGAPKDEPYDAYTPLMHAVVDDDRDMARLLLEAGASVNVIATLADTCAACSGRTWHYSALMVAAAEGRTEMAKLLLDRGADVNAMTASNNNPLLEAAEAGHTDIVKMLVERGADVKRFGSLAIQLARDEDHADVADLLLQAGAEEHPVSIERVGLLNKRAGVYMRRPDGDSQKIPSGI